MLIKSRQIFLPLFASLLVAACVTDKGSQDTSGFSEYAMKQRIAAGGGYADITALDEPINIRLKGSAESRCTQHEVEKFLLENREDDSRTEQVYSLVAGRLFKVNAKTNRGLTVEGSAPVFENGTLGNFTARFYGSATSLLTPEQKKQLQQFFHNKLSENLYAGSVVKTGDIFLDSGKFSEIILGFFRLMDPRVRIDSLENELLLRGVTTLNGRETLVSDGRIYATSRFLNRRFSFELKGFYAVDRESGLVREFISSTIASVDGIKFHELLIQQECMVTGGEVAGISSMQ